MVGLMLLETLLLTLATFEREADHDMDLALKAVDDLIFETDPSK